jgi:hypothetical protein
VKNIAPIIYKNGMPDEYMIITNKVDISLENAFSP